jgi:hypothetical protein
MIEEFALPGADRRWPASAAHGREVLCDAQLTGVVDVPKMSQCAFGVTRHVSGKVWVAVSVGLLTYSTGSGKAQRVVAGVVWEKGGGWQERGARDGEARGGGCPQPVVQEEVWVSGKFPGCCCFLVP